MRLLKYVSLIALKPPGTILARRMVPSCASVEGKPSQRDRHRERYSVVPKIAGIRVPATSGLTGMTLPST